MATGRTANTELISIVTPVYGCAGCLPELVRRVAASLPGKQLEFVLVNDASPDDAWPTIAALAQKDRRVRGVNLSRNFGQHAAISAGLDYARGRWVVIMDCDLQDRPEEIPRLYAKALEGFDAVIARRAVRRDSWLKRAFSKNFYRALSLLTGIQHDSSIANFGIYHRKVIDAVRSLRESVRFFPAMARWVGFRTALLDVEHAAREIGESAYNLRKALKLALAVMLAYSDRPLWFAMQAGFWIASAALMFGAIIVGRAIAGDFTVLGYASLMASVWFLGGVTIMTIGVVGVYVGRIFDDVKRRPAYLVQDTTDRTPPSKRGAR